MRVPIEWLADYVDVDLPVDELAHRLTMSGLKVEAIQRIGADWHDVVVAEVTEIEPHPSSRNPLWVAQVSDGNSTVTIVTGAPNVRKGDKVPLVPVGGVIPHGPDGGPLAIQRRPMAGIDSEGMLASARELGISDEHSGIYILPPDAPVGEPVRNILGGDVLEIETNPNRPDTLSIIGIAREVAALTQQQVTLPDFQAFSDNVTWVDEESIRVEVRAPDLCPRYSALRIEGAPDGSSPVWMATRLEACGMRPINLIVDITNYVMLELGQPMHAFDAAQLHGDTIIVRRAAEGERIKTLDGVERTLTTQNLVIADAERAVAVAGVMGGEDSEITPLTSTLVLESATFGPVSVRRTAQSLGLRTEASARFEKGLPPEQTIMGAMRFLQLLAQITDAPLRVARPSDVWVGPEDARTVVMPMRDFRRLIGIDISADVAAETLSLLGFEVAVSADAVSATVPYWRRMDIELSADLVEEVARLVGFDSVPVTLPRHTMPPPALPEGLRWEAVMRERALAIGLSESVTHSLTSRASMARLKPGGINGNGQDEATVWESLVTNPAGVFAEEALTLPVELANPATQDRSVLRLTLVPSLLDVLARNRKHTDESVAFFELDRTMFRRPEGLPYERRTLALALTGTRRPRSWETPDPGPFTFYDVKGMVESLLEALQVEPWRIRAEPHTSLHPGRSAVIDVGGHDVVYLGELHPQVSEVFELEGVPVQVAELDLDALFNVASDTRLFRALPRYPAAYRDVAVVVDEGTPAEEVMRLIRSAAGDLLESARIFDVYTGVRIPAGKKSIAVGLSFRAPGATLTQDEVNQTMERIIQRLRDDLGAALRE